MNVKVCNCAYVQKEAAPKYYADDIFFFFIVLAPASLKAIFIQMQNDIYFYI